ncbi:hypothetical protein N2152v2_007129 [Parachlorella kessleri]
MPDDPPPRSLLDLPIELLRRVLHFTGLKYGTLKSEQANLLSTQPAAALTLTTPRQAAQLAAWVAKRRPPLPQLTCTVAAQSDVQEAQDMEWQLRALWATLGVAAQQLTSLTWDAAYLRCSSTEVVHSHSGWLGSKFYYEAPPLHNLRSLTLVADAISLPVSYSSLAALTQLALSAMAVRLAPGCLPPRLRSLGITLDGEHTLSRDIVAQVKAAAVHAIASLCHLQLRWDHRCAVSMEGLSCLQALASLRLSSACLTLPPDLARLPKLAELVIEEAALQGGELVRLAALTKLHLLAVWGRADLRRVWDLPVLKHLHYIPVSQQRLDIPLGCQPHLESLLVDAHQAAANPAALQAMTALTQLALPCRRPPLGAGAMASLLQRVRQLPRLQRLSIGPLEDGGCCAGETEVEKELEQLKLARPGLTVERIDVFPVHLLWLDIGNGW